MSSEKKVSIVINCLNGEKYLKQCLESIVNQKYQNFEIIFWDNNSQDKSKEILNEYNDLRIKYYFSNKTEKLYIARNKAIKKTDGELIAFLDCDDWWNSDFLSARKEIFKDMDFDYFYSNTYLYLNKKKNFLANRKKKLPSGYIHHDLCKDYFIIISGLIVRRSIFLEIGYFNENYEIIGDFDFVMRIAEKFKAHYCNKFLLNYRVHENNFSKKNRKMFFEEFKNWYNRISNNPIFINYLQNFKNRLNYLEISYLIENHKNFNLLVKILKHKVKIEKIKLFLLFIMPAKIVSFLRK